MPGPLCLRLPDDLHQAVAHLAEQTGMSVSEWVRGLLVQTVYGTPPGVDDGYLAGRQAGYSAAMHALRQAMQSLPATFEEALPLAQLGSPGRTPKGG